MYQHEIAIVSENQENPSSIVAITNLDQVKTLHINKGDIVDFLQMDSLRRLYAVVAQNLKRVRKNRKEEQNKQLKIKINDLVLVKDCENAVSELTGEIIKGFQNGFYTAALFLDLSKAFDTLEHNVLLMKLEKYGI